MEQIDVIDLGLTPYREAWALQAAVQRYLIDEKLSERHGTLRDKRDNDIFILVEHPHVYTLGKSGNPANLLKSSAELRQLNAEYIPIDRGGDITYHGPGQIVGYPIMDLERYSMGIRDYIDALEEAIIRVCADYGIRAGRIDGLIGVWAGNSKICAIGVKCSHYVTMHGFAFNVSTDLSYFNHIVPCGIEDKDVTSLERILGREVATAEVKKKLITHFSQVFDLEAVLVGVPEELEQLFPRFKAE